MGSKANHLGVPKNLFQFSGSSNQGMIKDYCLVHHNAYGEVNFNVEVEILQKMLFVYLFPLEPITQKFMKTFVRTLYKGSI